MALQYQTSLRLWSILSGVFFAMLGFAPVFSTSQLGRFGLWSFMWRIYDGEFSRPAVAYAEDVLWHSILFAVLAVIFGWLVQAIVVIVVSYRRARKSTTP